MATNDVNLQVINSMTQDKMNSLKDADGKIPSLANQIIMTDEEDANSSCLRTEVIYDRLDPNKNLNKPDGIMGNVNVVIDLSKYAYIEVVPEIYNRASLNTGGWSGMYKLDLTTKKPSDSWNIAGYSSAYADDAQSSDINKVTWNFSLFYQASSKTFKWLIEFGGTSYNQNSECFISKIYGVLKEPAMIYTGAELFEGNGIKIENGVISSVQTVEALLSVSNPSSNTTKTISNISPYKTLVLLAHQTSNAYFGMSIPVPVFKMLTGGSERIVLSTDSKYFVVYYVNDTTIGLADVASGLDKFVVYGVK